MVGMGDAGFRQVLQVPLVHIPSQGRGRDYTACLRIHGLAATWQRLRDGLVVPREAGNHKIECPIDVFVPIGGLHQTPAFLRRRAVVGRPLPIRAGFGIWPEANRVVMQSRVSCAVFSTVISPGVLVTDSHDIPHVPAGVEVVPILDFGSQFVQLIARRVREAGAFSILLAPDTPVEVLKPRGQRIILSGGPSSVDGENAPTCDPRILDMGVPVLGVCYGLQLMQCVGGTCGPGRQREYGRAKVGVQGRGYVPRHPFDTSVWMSHGDQIVGVARWV